MFVLLAGYVVLAWLGARLEPSWLSVTLTHCQAAGGNVGLLQLYLPLVHVAGTIVPLSW